jgi:acetyltransferase-like isoleucine patch superfamily enzyme
VDHDCIIGDHAHIAPGVTLSGGVIVGERTHIGTGATVIQGIHIGESSLVGAGALILKDVPQSVTVMGVPAKVLKI